jgi:hypothetical protein
MSSSFCLYKPLFGPLQDYLPQYVGWASISLCSRFKALSWLRLNQGNNFL